MRSLPGRAVVVVLLAALLLPTACAAPTPLCGLAAPLLDGGRLAAAAELYAQALQADEGSCADEGLADVGTAYGRAYTEAAVGTNAERGGDMAAAVSAYETALRVDAANSVALAGLARLGRSPVRVETPIAVTAAPSSPVTPWWAVLAIGIALVALGGGAALLNRRRVSALASRLEASELRGTELDGLNTAMRKDLERGLDEAEQQHAVLRTAVADLEAGRQADRDAARGLSTGVAEELDEFRRHVVRTFDDHLRMVVLVGERGVPASSRRTSRAVLMWWPDLVEIADVGTGTPAPDRIDFVVTQVEDGRLVLHEFCVAAARVEMVSLLELPGLRPALRAFGAAPRDREALERLRAVLDATWIEPRGSVAVELPNAAQSILTVAEREFRRDVDGLVLFQVTRRTSPDRRRVDVCAVGTPSGASAVFDTSDFVPGLLELIRTEDEAASRARLSQCLSQMLRDMLVRSLTRTHTRLPAVPDGALLEVGPDLGVHRPLDVWPDECGQRRAEGGAQPG